MVRGCNSQDKVTEAMLSAVVSDPVSDATPADRPRQATVAIDAARRVLRIEADALKAIDHALAGRFGTAFAAAVDRLIAVSGRVVVTGMGKSGHIARKIAATLASTGTPALFVHPGEASHGDLGMITAKDGVLALSNSGETAELHDLIGYTRRFGIPLVAMTGEKGGTLAQEADTALRLPAAPEACPMGLAPTTSTSMMLALGDALAVALIERRGFGAPDFQVLHPGGKLGRRLLRVSELMHTGDRLPLIGPDASMGEAVLVMSEKALGCVGVIGDDGRLVGIVTDGDLRRHMAPDLMAGRVGTVMTPSPRTIRPQALAAEALGLMNARTITSLFVVDDDRPVGVLHIHDCLRAGIA